MFSLKKKSLAVATTVYWILLVYIIAALVWWFIELINQNKQMTNDRLNELTSNDPSYEQKQREIERDKKRKTAQYIGEGATFLALILVGAVFIYRAVRRQFQLQAQQQNFMMAITHELKTPIAVTKLNLETLQKHQLDEPVKQKLLAMTVEEANRLTDLANNILVSAQLEDTNYKKASEDFDLSSLVENCVLQFQRRYPDRNFVPEIETEIDLKGDVLLIEILVNNLLENAVKYAPADKSITCRLTRHNDRIELHIIDEGVGIIDKEKKNIFEKFYRLGSEQVRNSKGTGLGLYLCKKIAHDHHGTIKVLDNKPAGSDFAVFFQR